MLNLEGADCTMCRNGQEIVNAFKEVQAGEYDAILMDIQNSLTAGMDAHISKPIFYKKY